MAMVLSHLLVPLTAHVKPVTEDMAEELSSILPYLSCHLPQEVFKPPGTGHAELAKATVPIFSTEAKQLHRDELNIHCIKKRRKTTHSPLVWVSDHSPGRHSFLCRSAECSMQRRCWTAQTWGRMSPCPPANHQRHQASESCWLYLLSDKYVTLLHKGSRVRQTEALSIYEGLLMLQSLIFLCPTKPKDFKTKPKQAETPPDKGKGPIYERLKCRQCKLVEKHLVIFITSN